MNLKSFDEMIHKVKNQPGIRRVIVAAAADEHTLEAVFRAAHENIAAPILVGDKAEILTILKKLGASVPETDIYDIADPEDAAAKAVELIREDRGDFLMKGRLETAQLLRPVVHKETGIGTGQLMSHFTIFEAPYYHKLFAAVDGGMVMYPDFEQKIGIIRNTAEVFHKLGCSEPKAAVITAIEKVNPKMPETLEAAKLTELSGTDAVAGCMIEGPVSLDIALDVQAAQIKCYTGSVAGDADILLVPNIQVGNVLGKSITVIAGGKMAGFIVGAKVPIILTSRSSSSEEKYLSIVLASAVSPIILQPY